MFDVTTYTRHIHTCIQAVHILLLILNSFLHHNYMTCTQAHVGVYACMNHVYVWCVYVSSAYTYMQVCSMLLG